MAISNVDVLIPWRSGCAHRERSLEWVLGRYLTEHPSWTLVLGECSDGPFNRSEAILDAASRSSSDVVLVADGDVFCDSWSAIDEALEAATEHGWAIPHLLLHRLSLDSTDEVIAGAAWRGLPLSTDNPQDARPYRGKETGTMFAARRDVLLAVPPDVRFVGWGNEDEAHSLALRTLIGKPWRGTADLIHLWHPAPPRMNRRFGSRESRALYERYLHARRQPARMQILIDEAKEAARDRSAV